MYVHHVYLHISLTIFNREKTDILLNEKFIFNEIRYCFSNFNNVMEVRRYVCALYVTL